MGLALTSAGARTMRRCLDWHDDHSLFSAAAAAYPASAKATYQVADGLVRAGRREEAVPLFQRELQGCVGQYGIDHNETRTSAINLRGLLLELGDNLEAANIQKQFKLPD